MRKTIFKAKRSDTATWVEGQYFEQKLRYGGRAQIYVADAENEEEEDTGWTNVLRETLCQLTGKTYDGGKLVWENDLFEVKMNGAETHIEYFNCQVVWHEGCCAFVFKVISGDNPILWIAFNDQNILSIRFINNTHD